MINVITLEELRKMTGNYYTKTKLHHMIGNGYYWTGVKTIKVDKKEIDKKRYFSIIVSDSNELEQEYLVKC